MQEVTPRSVGAMIALYERAVGIYAALININAYHQPGFSLPPPPRPNFALYRVIEDFFLITFLKIVQEWKRERRLQGKC